MLNQWENIINGVNQIAELFESEAIFIGGIAVFLHASENSSVENLVEISHDADLMISRGAFVDIRDIYDVNTNKRLSKHEISINNESFDIYLEGSHSLCVPYEDAKHFSKNIKGVNVASLEHLLALKLVAAIDRENSKKGEKDKKDICCICLLAEKNKFNFEEANKFIDYQQIELIKNIQKSATPLLMANRNVVIAKKIRESLAFVVNGLVLEKNKEKNKEFKI